MFDFLHFLSQYSQIRPTYNDGSLPSLLLSSRSSFRTCSTFRHVSDLPFVLLTHYALLLQHLTRCILGSEGIYLHCTIYFPASSHANFARSRFRVVGPRLSVLSTKSITPLSINASVNQYFLQRQTIPREVFSSAADPHRLLSLLRKPSRVAHSGLQKRTS